VLHHISERLTKKRRTGTALHRTKTLEEENTRGVRMVTGRPREKEKEHRSSSFGERPRSCYLGLNPLGPHKNHRAWGGGTQ